MCCMAIVNARIKNLYFGAKEPKTGAVVSVDNFLDKIFLIIKLTTPVVIWSENLAITKRFFCKLKEKFNYFRSIHIGQ